MGLRATGLWATRLFLVALALFASSLPAEVTVSLPLQGYFRAGRFVPVWLQVRDESATILVGAPGAVPTEYHVTGNADVVVPWLPLLDSAGSPRVEQASNPVAVPHVLADDERLVAVAGEEGQTARALFPGNRVIVIPLDLSRPLFEPALAWEGIDGVVLTPASAKQLRPGQIELLASAGVVLAVRDGASPDPRWPWKREGDLWVLRQAPAGPRDVIEAAAYSPTYGWVRGRPAAFRRQVVFAALVFILIALAVSLWRSRATILAFVGVCAVSASLLAWWYSRQSPVLDLSCGVMISGAPASQIDIWHWRSPLRPSDDSLAFDGLTYPILPDANHAATTGLRLVCRPDGSPQAFEYHLEPRQSLAFLNRSIRTGATLPPLSPAREPFKSFASDLYLGPGEAIAGQFMAADPRSGQSVPVVVITRRPRE